MHADEVVVLKRAAEKCNRRAARNAEAVAAQVTRDRDASECTVATVDRDEWECLLCLQFPPRPCAANVTLVSDASLVVSLH